MVLAWTYGGEGGEKWADLGIYFESRAEICAAWDDWRMTSTLLA